MFEIVDPKMIVDTNKVQSKKHFFWIYSNFLNDVILNIPKLRTYIHFKTDFRRENYVVLDVPNIGVQFWLSLDVEFYH